MVLFLNLFSEKVADLRNDGKPGHHQLGVDQLGGCLTEGLKGEVALIADLAECGVEGFPLDRSCVGRLVHIGDAVVVVDVQRLDTLADDRKYCI